MHRGKDRQKARARARTKTRAKARARYNARARHKARGRSQVHLNCCWTKTRPRRESTVGFTIPHVTLQSRRGGPFSRPRLGQGRLPSSMLHHRVSRDIVIW